MSDHSNYVAKFVELPAPDNIPTPCSSKDNIKTLSCDIDTNTFDKLKSALVTEVLSAIKGADFAISQTASQQRKRHATNIEDSSDTVSLCADKYRRLIDESVPESSSENILPGGSPSEKSSDDFGDLLDHRQAAASQKKAADNNIDVVEDILLQVDEEMPQDVDYGLPIRKNLADRVISHFMTRSRQSETKKQILNRHKLPENCSDIEVPKLHNSVLSMKSFNEYQKRNEKQLYSMQAMLVKATTAVVSIVDAALSADANSKVVDTKDIVRNSLDAITLMGCVSHEISLKRKQNVKPAFSPQFQPLCSSSRPVTKYLLGDDLQKGMKEAQEASRLSNNISRHSPKYFPQQQSAKYPLVSSASKTNKPSFLEKGKKPQQGRQKAPFRNNRHR